MVFYLLRIEVFTVNENKDLEVNKKNSETYENLMNDAGRKLDGYWDSNDYFVRILLVVLAIIILVGSIFVFIR